MTARVGRVARVVAQAKVNLVLHVGAREASGFHAIETLFCRLTLGDDVEVRVLDRAERTLDVRGADVGPTERNLAWRAAVAYQERAGWPRGFAVAIEKRIPVGGGLGGGSADAGAVLRALDAMAPRPLGSQALLDLAMPLGSDVPFMATDVALALAWGRGERMLALPALPTRRVVLATFARGVPTGDAYGWLARSRGVSHAPRPALLDPARLASWDGVAALAANDFEHAVFAERPDIAAVRRALGDDAGAAGMTLMSGSGATVFRVDDGAPGLDVLRSHIAAAGGDGVADGVALVESGTAERVVGVAPDD